jgi:hypothetical protein
MRVQQITATSDAIKHGNERRLSGDGEQKEQLIKQGNKTTQNIA